MDQTQFEKELAESYLCIDGPHKGKYCACAGCRHEDGICIDHSSGSGCSVCDGPVLNCDTSEQNLDEGLPYDPNYLRKESD